MPEQLCVCVSVCFFCGIGCMGHIMDGRQYGPPL